MILYKVSYSSYDDIEKRFIRGVRYYTDQYIKDHSINLKELFSKRYYHNVEIENFSVKDDDEWYYLDGNFYKKHVMFKGVL